MTWLLWFGLVTGRLIWASLNFLLLFVYLSFFRNSKKREVIWLKNALVFSFLTLVLFCIAVNPYRDWLKADMIASLFNETHPENSTYGGYFSDCSNGGRIKITQWRTLLGQKDDLIKFYQGNGHSIEVFHEHEAGTAVVFVRIPESSIWVRKIPWTLLFIEPKASEPRLTRAGGTMEIHYDIHLFEAHHRIQDFRCVFGAP